MKNENVIKAFLRKENAHATNLFTKRENNKYVLVNYETPIAYIEGSTLWINQCKYSTSTSKIQSKLNYLASQQHTYEVVYYNEGKKDKKGGF